MSPAAIRTALLDENRYLCSVSTMYRILHSLDEVHQRRNVRHHPRYHKPELLATAPNQVWSWDITKLKGPVKWSYYYLYVIMDIYSRYTVGWMLAERETAALAKRLIKETCMRQEVARDKLIIHSDRGSQMTSKTVAQLFADLGVTKSLSRPQVSDDNPYSESQFGTLKSRPDFPDRFDSLEAAKAFSRDFFDWYNNDHYHSGIAMMTPYMVHYGLSEERSRARHGIMLNAFSQHPERFVNGMPKILEVPKAAWINKPKSPELEGELCATTGGGIIIGAVR